MQTAQIIGTPSYMSPEQIKGRPVDGRSDIFSLGVVLYELVTGHKPFPGDSVTTVIYKIVNENPVPPQQLDSSIHPGLSAVIAKALAKPVEQRFQTCHEFIEALQNYVQFRDASTEATMVLPGPGPAMTPRASAEMAARMAAARGGAAPVAANVPSAARTHHPILTGATPAKRRGSVLLALLLLVVIGAAGYQVFPAVREIWQRSQPDREAAELKLRPAANLIEKATGSKSAPAAPAAAAADEPAPASTEETASAKSPAPPAAAADAATPAAGAANATTPKVSAAPPRDVPQPAPAKPNAKMLTAAGEKSPTLAPQDVSQAVPNRPASPSADAAAPAAEATAPAATSPAVVPAYKPSRPAASPAAAAWQLRISAILVESNIADRVRVVATGNTLTLTGTLRLPQHRRLLARLRNVPDRVQIIDDIEYAPEDPAADDAATPDAADSAPGAAEPAR